jgi:hypothetical protein
MSAYNGWTNYETWLVNLWLDNDSGSYAYVREMAEEARTNPERNEFAEGGFLSPAYTLGRQVKDYVEELLDPQTSESGLASDLITAALSEVNWTEIATAALDGLDPIPESDDE